LTPKHKKRTKTQQRRFDGADGDNQQYGKLKLNALR
jgi:hypothetical protein